MLIAKNLHVQITFMMQRFNNYRIVYSEIQSLENVKNSSNSEDVVEINVDDVAGEREVVKFS